MTIPNMPEQLDRAAAGTDPRGWLAFDAPLPDALQRAEDSTAEADRDKARLFKPRGHTRPATAAEKTLLAHLGYQVPDELDTVVSWPSRACRRRRWPALETASGGIMTEPISTPEPEPRSEAWAATADEPTPDVDESALDPQTRAALQKARREAHSLRTRLRDTEGQLEQAAARISAHELATIEQAAKAAGFYDPSDFVAVHPDVSGFRDEFSELMPDKVAEAAQAVLDAKPYLGRTPGGPPTDRPIEGLRPGARAPEDKKAEPSWHTALRGG